jgi:hypothetical protein
MPMDNGGGAQWTGSGGLSGWSWDVLFRLFRVIRVSGCMLLALSPAGNCLGEETEKVREEQPSMEMLEFLGEWQTGEGVWFDPTEKEQQQASAQEQSHD